MSDYIVNAAGRRIPKYIEGYGPTRPFAGAFDSPPPESAGARFHARFHPRDYVALKATLDEALQECGIKDGMRIGFNHDLRNGDAVVMQVVEACERLGIKGLILCPTALFEVHAGLVKYLENGVIRRIEGSLNGSIGKYVSEGNLAEGEVALLRSHGGRAMALALGTLQTDITIVTASSADRCGNANGMYGKNPLGFLPFSQTEAMFSKQTIVVTDTLVDYPNLPIQIDAAYVDYVVVIDSIGDASKITSGTLELREREPDLTIARSVSASIVASGYLKNGFVTQAGAGNVSLLSLRYLAEVCQEKGIKGSVLNGGTTSISLDFLNKGLVEKLVTGQSFDVANAESLLSDYPKHCWQGVLEFYGCYTAGAGCHQQDFATMSATEVDVNFNANVNTHSDGYLLHGIGGHQDACAGAKMLMITVPTFRKTNPTILENVTTVTTPGECVTVIVTESGIAVNPRHPELKQRLIDAGVNVKSIEELREIGVKNAGRDYTKPITKDRIIAVIEWRDGTVLDVVYQVDKEATMEAKAKIREEIEAKANQ